MAYGLEVLNENGDTFVDNEHLLHRVWHYGAYDSTGNYYYDNPLDHEPTIVAWGLNGNSYFWEHLTDGSGNYTGFNLYNPNPYYEPGEETIIIAFARK